MSLVNPISSLPSSALSALQQAQAAQQTPATPSTDGSGFAASLTGAVDNVQALQSTANTLSLQAVTGNLDDIADATIAMTRAQTTLELVSTVRNKGVDAFNQIMNMQS